MLKIAPTDLDHQERRALQYFAGITKASVQLLDYDDQYHAVLLQYLSGPLLESFFPERDVQAVEVIVNLVKSFHQKPSTPDQLAQFKVSQLARIKWCLDNPDSTKIPRDLLVKAQELYEMLLRTQSKLYVLHGDFHHCNILWDDSSLSWVAVDPRGIVGELEAETTPFIVNPIPELLAQDNAAEIIKCRIDRFVEAFDLDRQRLHQWLFILPVHGACWGEQTGYEHVDYFIRFAQFIEKCL